MSHIRLKAGVVGAYLIVLIIASAVSVIFYFLFFERPYLRYTNVPFPALITTGHPGQPMPIHVGRCNDDDVPHVYDITRTMERVTKKGESRDYILMPDLHVNIMPGCSEGDAVMHIIPSSTPDGTWRLVGLSEVRGVLTTHMVEWYSVPFDVESLPLQVIKGERGEPGETGAKGSPGKPGAVGATGAIGATGAQGAKGSFFGGK